MYFSYVHSILEYADILFCKTSQENLKQIVKPTIQKRAGKIVSGAIRCTSSDAKYEELSWQRLSDIFRYNTPWGTILSSFTHSRNCRKQSTSPLSSKKTAQIYHALHSEPKPRENHSFLL